MCDDNLVYYLSGLRIVYGCIKDISYSNTMKMNHLMLRLTHDGSITD